MTELHAPEQSTLRVQGLPTAENRWQVQCLNCDAPISGAFCSNCGQRAVPPSPTMRELAGDAFAELSGWDGKLAESFRSLLQRPGELTRQWIDGKRVSFITPLRMYLLASLLYFGVVAVAPTNLRVGTANGPQVSLIKTEQTTAPGRMAERTETALTRQQALTGAERDSALADIAKAPAFLRPMMRKAVDDPTAFATAVRRAMPNVFLALVPIFALVTALFYRRRHYPVHLYFAVHLFTFLFIARTIGNLALFTRSIVFAGVVQSMVLIWIAAYGVIAFRRVYGGSIPMTILKGIGICFLYALIAAPIIAGVAFLVVST
jgi:hypothetical protein